MEPIRVTEYVVGTIRNYDVAKRLTFISKGIRKIGTTDHRQHRVYYLTLEETAALLKLYPGTVSIVRKLLWHSDSNVRKRRDFTRSFLTKRYYSCKEKHFKNYTILTEESWSCFGSLDIQTLIMKK